MKANELRIGNWVQSDTNRAYKIELTWFECCKDSRDGRDIQFNTYPIPLTEEWLVKFGFILADKGSKERRCYHKAISEDNVFEIWKQDDLEFEECRLWNNTDSYKMHFDNLKVIPKHVHQLQNLYFALINNELTLKDNG